jgi:hypothetical protein
MKSLKEVNESKEEKILSEIEILDSELAINPDDSAATVKRSRLMRALTTHQKEVEEQNSTNESEDKNTSSSQKEVERQEEKDSTNKIEDKSVPSHSSDIEQHHLPEQSAKNKHSRTASLPPTEETEKVLLKMTSDTLIYSLEKKLRTEADHWLIAKIDIRLANRSYTASYCEDST